MSRDTPDTTTADEDPSLEMSEAQSIPLEPEVIVVPCPGTPAPEKEDSDCQIVEGPTAPFKPKKGWARKRMEQTMKTLVLCIPRADGSAIKKEETGAAQKEDSPAPRQELTQKPVKQSQTLAMVPWMSSKLLS